MASPTFFSCGLGAWPDGHVRLLVPSHAFSPSRGQMDTYAFSCQDRSLRNRWLTPVASRAGAANAELIISHCHVYHTGWGGGDAAKVNGSEATLWEGSVGQQLRARMTTLPPKMDALAELPSQPQR